MQSLSSLSVLLDCDQWTLLQTLNTLSSASSVSSLHGWLFAKLDWAPLCPKFVGRGNQSSSQLWGRVVNSGRQFKCQVNSIISVPVPLSSLSPSQSLPNPVLVGYKCLSASHHDNHGLTL